MWLKMKRSAAELRCSFRVGAAGAGLCLSFDLPFALTLPACCHTWLSVVGLSLLFFGLGILSGL